MSNSQLVYFRNTFFAGLLTLVPIGVTIFIANWIFNLLTGRTMDLLIRFSPAFDGVPKFAVRVFALVLSVAIIWLVGLVTRNVVGKRILRLFEDLFERLPMLGSVYTTAKQMGQALLSSPGTAMFEKVALIEYPKEKCYALVFVTADAYRECNEAVGEDMISVFLPTTPNPTSGFLLFLPRTRVTILRISVSEAMRLIVSAGAVKPMEAYNLPKQTPEKPKAEAPDE